MACDWSLAVEDDLTRHGRNEAAIAHHAETGHTIEAVPTLDRTPSSGWAEQWPPE